MRSVSLTSGRRLLVVLEDGDEVIAGIAAACAAHGIERAALPVVSGAFRSVRLIGTREPVADPEPPLPASVTVLWAEGIAQGTVCPGPAGAPAVHLHAAVGVKDEGSAAYAGHVLAAVAHYTVEVVIDEVIGSFHREPDPRAHGIPTIVME